MTLETDSADMNGLDRIIAKAIALQRAATKPEDYPPSWNVLRNARSFGRGALEAGLSLLAGDDIERSVGCDLLSVLCNPDEEGWSHEIAVAVVKLAATEEDDEVCWSIAEVLDHAADPVGIPTLIRWATHPDSDIRFKVATGLPSCQDSDVTVSTDVSDTLLKLMCDESDEVRDWATFGLGQLLKFRYSDHTRCLLHASRRRT